MSLDFSQLKSLIIDGVELNQLYISNYNNLISSAIDTNGTIYNGCGYIEGYRLSSSGALKEQSNTITSGFIPCAATSVIRIAGVVWLHNINYNTYNYLTYYDSNFTMLGSINVNYDAGGTVLHPHGNLAIDTSQSVITVDENGCTTFQIVFEEGQDPSNIAYFRINGIGQGSNMVVTVDKEIQSICVFERYLYTNRVLKSTEADDVTIYNGDLGYKNGYRVRSGGAEGATSTGSCTGFIPVKGGDIVRLSGWDFANKCNENAINVADSTHTNIGQFTMLPAQYGIFTQSAYKEYSYGSVVQEKTGVWKWIVPPAASGVAYIRVSGYSPYPVENNLGSKMIVTINEEIV